MARTTSVNAFADYPASRFTTTFVYLEFLTNREKFTLKLRFRSDIEELVLYQPSLTRIELLAYAGGYLGIWLGVSALAFLLDLHGTAKTHRKEIGKLLGDVWAKKLRSFGPKQQRWTDRVIPIR